MNDALLQIQKGLVAGAKIINKYGYNYAIGTAAAQTIWTGQTINTGQYGYGLRAEPGTFDIVSSAADTVEITVQGLDAKGYELEEKIILTGTVTKTGTKIFSKIFRAFNSDSVDLIGNVTGYVTGSVLQADKLFYIALTDQQTLMALYTIPTGKTGFCFGYDISTGKGKEARISVHTRLPGGVFRIADMIVSYQFSTSKEVPYHKMPAGTDIEIRGTADADNTNASARFKILLLDNDKYNL